MTIFCATSNQGKLREFQLAGAGFEVAALDKTIPPPEELGETFEENAISKAIYYSGFTPGYLFADDSGLEVDALHGAPGVHSARFAGEHATDAANNTLLLEKLQGKQDRVGRFVCVIALVKDGKPVGTFRGSVEGRILDQAQGTGGFGYDPLFFYEPFGCSFGEAAISDKMQVSHRAQALEAMFTFLRDANSASNAGTRS